MHVISSGQRYAAILLVMCVGWGCAGALGQEGDDAALWGWVVRDAIPLKDGDETVCTLHRGDMVRVIRRRGATVEVTPFSWQQQQRSGWLPLEAVLHEDDAWRHFTELVKQRQHVAQAYYGRAMLRIYGSHAGADVMLWQHAREDLSEAIRHDENHIAARTARAVINMRLGVLNEAAADLGVIIRRDPSNPWAYLKRAECHGRLGDVRANRDEPEEAQHHYRQALDDYNRAIKLAPDAIAGYHGRANVYVALSEFDRAIHDLDCARELDPHSFAPGPRVRALMGQERYRAAIDIVDDAISRGSEHSELYTAKGKAHLALGHYGLALSAFERATEYTSVEERAAGWLALAWLLATSPDARYRDGNRSLDTALKACVHVALTKEREHFDFLKAMDHLQRLPRTFRHEWIREGWRDSSCLDVLAAAYAECGQFQAAVAWQEEAVRIAPEDRRPELAQRLSLYRKQRPYRLEPPAAAAPQE